MDQQAWWHSWFQSRFANALNLRILNLMHCKANTLSNFRLDLHLVTSQNATFLDSGESTMWINKHDVILDSNLNLQMYWICGSSISWIVRLTNSPTSDRSSPSYFPVTPFWRVYGVDQQAWSHSWFQSRFSNVLNLRILNLMHCKANKLSKLK